MKLSMRIQCAVVVALLMAGGAAAQMVTMNGEVKDKDGKPFPGLTVIIKSVDFGSTAPETKTDAKGRFMMAGLRSGVYSITLKNGESVIRDDHRCLVRSDADPCVIDFKELIAKQGAEYAEAAKKQEQETAKFEDMKTHFEAGMAAFNQAKQVREEMQKAPADQKPALQEKWNQLTQTAVTEYQAAEKAAPEKDANLHKVLSSLGQAYEAAGMPAESAASYERAIALRPTEAGYYMGWGTSLARAGKVDEAGAACEKAVPIDKAQGATCWRNVGIILYNTNKVKEAAVPFKRATELDPGYADTWYLLGASMVAAMEYKKEGDKYVTVVLPGTAEAYQKYLELAPNGRFAGDAKAGLDMLATLGAGIDTKMKPKGKKN